MAVEQSVTSFLGDKDILIPILLHRKRGKERDMQLRGKSEHRRGNTKTRIMAVVMAVAMLSVQLFSAAPVNKASAEGDTADLRIMFTTDLHGQVVDVDYSKGTLFPKGGLS